MDGMFFFFRSKNTLGFSIFMQAFDIICGRKLRVDYYCSMEKYFCTSISQKDYQKKLKAQNSIIAGLYNLYPPIDEAEEYWENFWIDMDAEGYKLSFEEAEAIVYWVYRLYKTIAARRNVTQEAFGVLETFLKVESMACTGKIIYLADMADVEIITSFRGFCSAMEFPEEANYTMFYRGHASAEYKLLPSVMRKAGWLAHENDMYNELKINCVSDFAECRTHLDYLVEMQHYGLPTRLLDVTQNPLVALYFACVGEKDKYGEIIVFNIPKKEIRYPGSDLVSIIASLPLIQDDKKKEMMTWLADRTVTDMGFNQKAKALLHEIKLEKPAFKNQIRKKDVGSAVVVLSEKKNNRIVKQDGAFIICGLFDENSNPINELRYMENGKRQIFIVSSKAKADILKQLDRFSINQATLFPEIEDVAGYIKTKY